MWVSPPKHYSTPEHGDKNQARIPKLGKWLLPSTAKTMGDIFAPCGPKPTSAAPCRSQLLQSALALDPISPFPVGYGGFQGEQSLVGNKLSIFKHLRLHFWPHFWFPSSSLAPQAAKNITCSIGPKQIQVTEPHSVPPASPSIAPACTVL